MYLRRLKYGGFTLIELMITVTIISILAVIVYPSYQQSIYKARRMDAKNVLLQAANWMEQFYTLNHRYDQDIVGNSVLTIFPDERAGPGLNKSPIGGETAYYSIELSNEQSEQVTATTFVLQAIPNPDTKQIEDKCQTLTLTQAGVKGVKDTTMTAEDCWR